MEPLIITVAPTGSSTMRRRRPCGPLTPEEIADEVARSFDAGAAIAHIHVRDDQGRASMELEKPAAWSNSSASAATSSST